MVYFRCIASPKTGLGHIKRCLILARQFRNYGQTPVFLISEDDTKIAEMLKREGMALHLLPADLPLHREPEHYPAQCRDMIVDLLSQENLWHQDGLVAYLHGLVAGNRRVLFFDGLFKEAFRNPDAPALFGYLQPYPGAEENTRPKTEHWFVGESYTILDECYMEPPKRREPLRAGRTLITFGGSDPQQNTLKVMRALAEEPSDMIFRVIIGPWFSKDHEEKIRLLAQGRPNRFALHESPSDLRCHYEWAELAITGSGSSRYELAAMGVPSLFVAIYPHHQALSEAFAKTGTSIYLGPDQDVEPKHWREAVREVLKDQVRRQDLSTRGRELVDGKGAERLIKQLMEDYDYGI